VAWVLLSEPRVLEIALLLPIILGLELPDMKLEESPELRISH
jgi:hypothetical protein